MQFTGLAFEGQKIFEGDLVEVKFTEKNCEDKEFSYSEIGVVEWINPTGEWYVEVDMRSILLSDAIHGYTTNRSKITRVCGNVYENRELLYGEEA